MENRNQDLIERIWQHDVEALSEYLDVRRHQLMAVINRKMGDTLRKKVDPEDVFQETSSRAIEDLHQMTFDGDDPFAWVCRIADRKIVDLARRFSAQKRAADKEIGLYGSTSDQSGGGIINLLVASITSPSAAFSRQQKEFKLLEALSKLSEQQQQVLHLRFSDGLASKEIAEKIGKSDGATRVIITRSLKKLEELIAEMEGDVSR